MDINRELAELLGLCKCDDPTCELVNECCYDFTSSDGKIELLRLMEKQGSLALFMVRLIYVGDTAEAIDWDNNIPYDYLKDTTGRLARAAVEFLRGKS
jgi:hypothetical protein